MCAAAPVFGMRGRDYLVEREQAIVGGPYVSSESGQRLNYRGKRNREYKIPQRGESTSKPQNPTWDKENPESVCGMVELESEAWCAYEGRGPRPKTGNTFGWRLRDSGGRP